jgi:hypothetical protein
MEKYNYLLSLEREILIFLSSNVHDIGNEFIIFFDDIFFILKLVNLIIYIYHFIITI